MYRFDLCNTNILQRNNTKHIQSKKHKYYSNKILNRYAIKDVEVNKFKDTFDPYFIEHTKKFDLLEVCFSSRFEYGDTDPCNHKIGVSNYVTYNIHSENYSTYSTESASDFLHRVMQIYLSDECSPKIIPEIEIVFISDLQDITKQHYLELPKSMLCRKLIRRFHESTQDFKYKWLPDSFKDFRVSFTF